jgi:O-antigen ligase
MEPSRKRRNGAGNRGPSGHDAVSLSSTDRLRPGSIPLFALLIPLFVILPMYFGQAEWKVFLAEGVMAVGTLYTLSVLDRQGAFRLLRQTRFLPLFFLLASAASLLWSPCRQRSLASLVWVVAVFLWVLLVSSLTVGEIKLLVGLGTLTGMGFAAFSILQYMNYFPHPYWPNAIRLSGTFTNSNHFASFLTLVFPAGLAYAVRRGNAALRVGAAAGASVCILALLLTTSRGGWLSGLAAGLYFLFLCPVRKPWKRLLLVLVLAALTGGLFWVALEMGWLHSVWERWTGSGTYSMVHRLSIWKGTLRMIAARPFGTGIGTYALVFPLYRTFSDSFYVNAAHNDFLELTAEVGIQGLFLSLALFVVWVGPVAAFLRRTDEKRRDDRILAAALFSSVLALLLQAFYDFALQKAAVALLFFLAVTACFRLAETPRPRPAGGRFERVASGSPLVLALFVLCCSPLFLVADRQYRKALRGGETLLQTIREGNGRGAVPEERDPGAPRVRLADVMRLYGQAYRCSLGNFAYANSAGDFCTELAREFPLGWERNLAEAATWYARAVGKNPYDARSHLSLAGINQIRGDNDSAEIHFQAAVASDPMWGEYRRYYALFLFSRGRTEQGLATYLGALDLFPTNGPADRQQYALRLLDPSVPPAVAAKYLPQEPETAAAVYRELLRSGAASKGMELLRARETKLPEPVILAIGAEISKTVRHAPGPVPCEFFSWAHAEYAASKPFARELEECRARGFAR